MDISPVAIIFRDSIQGKLYRVCTVFAFLFLILSFTTILIEVDIHKLRITSFMLCLLGAIIWIRDEQKYNYWKHVNSDDYSPHCDYTKEMAESEYHKDLRFLSKIHLVVALIIIFLFYLL
jgi:hypothetical protein